MLTESEYEELLAVGQERPRLDVSEMWANDDDDAEKIVLLDGIEDAISREEVNPDVYLRAAYEANRLMLNFHDQYMIRSGQNRLYPLVVEVVGSYDEIKELIEFEHAALVGDDDGRRPDWPAPTNPIGYSYAEIADNTACSIDEIEQAVDVAMFGSTVGVDDAGNRLVYPQDIWRVVHLLEMWQQR